MPPNLQDASLGHSIFKVESVTPHLTVLTGLQWASNKVNNEATHNKLNKPSRDKSYLSIRESSYSSVIILKIYLFLCLPNSLVDNKTSCCCCWFFQSSLTLCDPMDCSLQARLSKGFPRQEYWTGLPFLSQGDLPDPWMEPMSPKIGRRVLYVYIPIFAKDHISIFAKDHTSS